MREVGMEPHVCMNNESGCSTIKVYSQKWGRFFAETLKIAKGSRRKCLPPGLLRYNVEFVKGVMAGIVDGDGCIRQDPYGTDIDVGVSSHGLISQLQLVFDVFGVNSYCNMQFQQGREQVCVIHGKERIMRQNMPVYRLTVRLTQNAMDLLEYSYKLQNKSGIKVSKPTAPNENCAISAIKEHPTVDEYVYDFSTSTEHFLCNGVRIHNCSSHSPVYVAKYGLTLPNQNSGARPAKYADVLLEQIVKFSAAMQGHFSGAIGLEAVNVFLAPYLVGKTEKELKQLAQIVIYEFSQQAAARGGQVIFSDLNLYWGTPSHYRDVEAIGPGGQLTGLRYKDYDEEAKAFLRALMSVYMDGDGSGRPFFFPKPDCHITEESVKDDEYLNLLGEVASARGNPYFIFDRGSDPSLAQCCFDKDTRVIYRSDNHVYCKPFSEVRQGSNFKVFHNGSWVDGRKVTVPRNGKRMFRLRTANNKELLATEDHLFPTLRGDVTAAELTTDDYVMFSTRAMENEPHYENGMTYEQGVLIGAFLGDGSYNGCGLSLSLNKEKHGLLKPLVEAAYEQVTGVKKEMSLRVDGNLYAAYIGGNGIADFVRSWVIGTTAGDKALNLDVLRESVEFREGILFGWEATDGGNAHRTYTVSKALVESMEILCTSLGIQTKIDIFDRRDEPMVINGETFVRNFPLYCLRQFHPKNHRNKSGVYSMRNNSIYFRLTEVEELKDYDEDVVYCFEMKNQDEPYFTMPSGWIVHNCRLRVTLDSDDIEDLKEPWKIRFVGVQNVSINLPGIAFRNRNNESRFYDELAHTMELAGTAHKEKMDFVQRIQNLGARGPLELLNMRYDGRTYVRPEKCKFLMGIVGLNEAVQMLTGEQLHESSAAYKLGMKIVAFMHTKAKEIGKDLDFNIILEQTPAESTAYRFAKLDLNRYGQKMRPFLRGNVDTKEIYYTNSSQLNVSAPLSAIERVKMEGRFHPLIDAGSMTHIWLGESQPPAESIAAFVRNTHYKTKNAQIDFSPEFTTCNACFKTSRGLSPTCSSCGSTNVKGITRVTGYFSVIQGWNIGKQAELKDRYRLTI
jgi:anaerobic ribonucleoside-triphosphate reductase